MALYIYRTNLYPPLRKGRLGGDDLPCFFAYSCYLVIPSSASPFQGEDTS